MKSKVATITSISQKDKEQVWIRQGGKSIFPPYYPITISECCCHFVSRTGNDRGFHKGMSVGVGYEWNIFGCTQNEHRQFDNAQNGNDQSERVKIVHDHLAQNYLNWSVEKCHYKKGFERNDYGVERNY